MMREIDYLTDQLDKYKSELKAANTQRYITKTKLWALTAYINRTEFDIIKLETRIKELTQCDQENLT